VARSWGSSLVRWSGLIVAVCLAAPGVVLAQAQEGFVPMAQAGPREALPAAPLVMAAYAFVWVALLAYLFIMWRRLGRVERELADVTARLRAGQRS
jgi:CcmD family protein